MKVDAGLAGGLPKVAESVRALEAQGFDGVVSAEISHDPFLPLALAAAHSERVDLMTSIAVAFSRNPMSLAQVGHDLNSLSRGRFVLGLGSQIRPHITKRFSMPWSAPAARMRELILAMRSIWSCWYEGEPLEFRGEFYTHTLMTPMFVPEDREHGSPRVFLAAVGPKMTEVAGEVADGMIAHAFTTERYLREVTLPAIERGRKAAGREGEPFEISCPVFVVTGADARSFADSRAATAKQIAFYGSTPAYRPVLESCGRGELQPELNRLSKQGEWDEMGERIDDELLEQFAVVGAPDEIAGLLRERCGGLVDRVMCTFPFVDAAQREKAMKELRG